MYQWATVSHGICASYAIDNIGGGTLEVNSDLNGSLESIQQVLHRERAHLKVIGWSLVIGHFLSRLNEISGSCEKIITVSESF